MLPHYIYYWSYNPSHSLFIFSSQNWHKSTENIRFHFNSRASTSAKQHSDDLLWEGFKISRESIPIFNTQVYWVLNQYFIKCASKKCNGIWLPVCIVALCNRGAWQLMEAWPKLGSEFKLYKQLENRGLAGREGRGPEEGRLHNWAVHLIAEIHLLLLNCYRQTEGCSKSYSPKLKQKMHLSRCSIKGHCERFTPLC